jgi:hypothetical protein
MLLQNMNVKDGLCNGTRFFLDAFNTNVLVCTMIQDDLNKPEKKFILPRISLSPPSTTHSLLSAANFQSSLLLL